MTSIHSPARRERDVAQGAAPKLEDFPEAEVVGGALILNGKNMGSLTVGGDVEPSALGRAYLETAEQDAVQPMPITEVPDPVPPGVIDPATHEKVLPVAKQAVRQRKQNELVIDAMNSPTDEQEAAFEANDEAAADNPNLTHPGESPTVRANLNNQRDGMDQRGGSDQRNKGKDSNQREDNQRRGTKGNRGSGGPDHEGSPSSGAAQQPPGSY
jgi:hypothetical protein